MGVTQFGVFPIVVSGRTVGCIYADRGLREPAPDRQTVDYVSSLCALIVKAIEFRRSVAARSGEPTAEVKSALVLRVLRGESMASVAESGSVTEVQLEQWRAAFLEGAMARLSQG